jgi:hypothetical protein
VIIDFTSELHREEPIREPASFGDAIGERIRLLQLRTGFKVTPPRDRNRFRRKWSPARGNIDSQAAAKLFRFEVHKRTI